MSEESRKRVQSTEHHLQHADEHLSSADRHAQQSGDKQLVQKIQKAREGVQEIRKEIERKMTRG